jgi:hypothetical protein
MMSLPHFSNKWMPAIIVPKSLIDIW